MSTAVFAQVSKRLQQLIEDSLRADENLNPKPKVVLDDPATLPSGQDSTRISLWLYQVIVDEFSRNASTPSADDRTDSRRRFRLPPLGVNLYYLITPILGNSESDQRALARIMLTLHENSILGVTQKDSEVNERVRISVLTESFDDRIKLWESLGKPYRLSIGYEVRTVRLVSKQVDDVVPVGSTTTALAQQPGPAGGG